MEFLIELVIEMFGEIIITLLAKVVEMFAVTVTLNTKLRNMIKNLLSFIFIGLTIVLITISFIHSKNFLVVIALSYSLLQLGFMIVSLITKRDPRFIVTNKIIFVIRKLSHYIYPILLIIFGSIYLTNQNALIWLNILSTLSLLTFFSIHMYRIWRRSRKDLNP